MGENPATHSSESSLITEGNQGQDRGRELPVPTRIIKRALPCTAREGKHCPGHRHITIHKSQLYLYLAMICRTSSCESTHHMAMVVIHSSIPQSSRGSCLAVAVWHAALELVPQSKPSRGHRPAQRGMWLHFPGMMEACGGDGNMCTECLPLPSRSCNMATWQHAQQSRLRQLPRRQQPAEETASVVEAAWPTRHPSHIILVRCEPEGSARISAHLTNPRAQLCLHSETNGFFRALVAPVR